MKTYLTIIIALVSISFTKAQLIKNVDYVSPFNNGLAAVQKGDSWAFIDEQGAIVIDYRNDLVTSKEVKYPKFENGRCLIFTESDNIRLYGYIDKTGNTVVSPQFLGPVDFNDHHLAIVQKLNKDVYGINDLLKKNLVRYTYNEVIINDAGKILNYLNGPTHVIPYIDKMPVAPEIISHLLSPSLVATMDDDKKWLVLQITNPNN